MNDPRSKVLPTLDEIRELEWTTGGKPDPQQSVTIPHDMLMKLLAGCRALLDGERDAFLNRLAVADFPQKISDWHEWQNEASRLSNEVNHADE